MIHDSEETTLMKIVAFEGQGGARLGIVEGDQVIDLQAADGNAAADLGEMLAKNNGDTAAACRYRQARSRRARASRSRI